MTKPGAYSVGGTQTGILDPSLSPLGGVRWHLDLQVLAYRLASHPYTQLIKGRCCSWEISRLPSRSAASEMPPLSGNDGDTLSCDSGASAISTSYVSSLVPSHRPWASKSGRHVLGPAEDYDALCEQIARGQTLLTEMDLQIREAPSPTSQELVTKVTLAMALDARTGEQEAEAGGKGAVGSPLLGRGARKGSPETHRAGPVCRLFAVWGGHLLRRVPVLLRSPCHMAASVCPSVLSRVCPFFPPVTGPSPSQPPHSAWPRS